MEKVVVFGSAFNPPTLGHKDAIEQCFLKGADKVILVPSFSHAFGKNMGSYNDRLKMTHAFASDLNKEGLNVVATCRERGFEKDGEQLESMIEHEISMRKGSGASSVYSFDLMEHFSKTYPDSEFVLAFGEDNIDNLHKFYKGDELEKRWGVMALKDQKPIRSTLVRNSFVAGGASSIESLVTPSVLKLIINTEQKSNW